jgi:Uma2 family endonuclease
MELKTRFPDLSIITAEQRQAIRLKAAVLESPPLLVVEIVSPESVKRDYRYKRSEYAVLEIPEYWIVDPLEAKVTVLLLVEGLYEETEFRSQQIISHTFPELTLTVEQVLSVV